MADVAIMPSRVMFFVLVNMATLCVFVTIEVVKLADAKEVALLTEPLLDQLPPPSQLLPTFVAKVTPPPLAVLMGNPQELCEATDFKPSCATRDEVVVMARAVYGRMELGKCVQSNYGYIGCQGDVTGHLDFLCSGKQNCSVRLPDTRLSENVTCPKEFKLYLVASYYCVPIERAVCDQCRSRHIRVTTSKSGYLASSVALDPLKCGTSQCPWKIEVRSGQTINITLYDFGLDKFRRKFHNQTKSTCHLYAYIKEPSVQRNIHVCGSKAKVLPVFSSVSNVVEIAMVTPETSEGQYLFYYEAVGCPDYITPERAWAKRYGEKIIVGCNSSYSDKWEVRCVDKQWVGETGSCPEANIALSGAISLPLGVLIAIVLGIALVIGVLIVTVGIVYLKRQQRELMYPPCGPNMATYMVHEPFYEIDSLDPETMQALNTIQRKKQQQLEQALTLQKQKQQQLLLHHDEQRLRTLDKKAAKKAKLSQKRQRKKGRSMSEGGKNVYARTGMESRPLPSIPVSQGRPDPPVRMDSTVSIPPQSASMGSVRAVDYGGGEAVQGVQVHPQAGAAIQARTNSPVLQVHVPPSAPCSTSATPGPGFGTSRRPAKPLRTSSSVKSTTGAPPTEAASLASIASQGPTQHYTMLDPLEVQQLMAMLPQQHQHQVLQQQQQQQIYPQYHPLQSFSQLPQQQLPQHSQQQLPQHLQFPPPPPQAGDQGVDLRPCREGSQPVLSDQNIGTSSWP